MEAAHRLNNSRVRNVIIGLLTEIGSIGILLYGSVLHLSQFKFSSVTNVRIIGVVLFISNGRNCESIGYLFN